MKKIKGKIILIDDEKIELEFLKTSLRELDYDVDIEYFEDAAKGLDYLKKTSSEIFLIISDIKMPVMDGIQLKAAIDADPILRRKAIPFVFATNAVSKEIIARVYEHSVQGLFRKPGDLKQMTEIMSTIIKYWDINLHPNKKVPFTEHEITLLK
jgi:CheY-like chemotaxis protein